MLAAFPLLCILEIVERTVHANDKEEWNYFFLGSNLAIWFTAKFFIHRE